MGQCEALTAENTTWNQCPNYPLSIAFVGVFLITLVIHIIQAVNYRKKYCLVVIAGALMETAAYVFRSMGIKKPSNQNLYVYWFMLLMVAPIPINAFIYMTLGRMVYNFTSKAKVFNIKAWRFGLYFVCLDIFAFIVQMLGALIASKQDASISRKELGIHIYMGGIGIQQFFILGFLIIAIRFHWHIKQESNSSQALKLLYVQYLILLLITVRIVFRLVEYSAGFKVGLSNHEVYQYTLDSVPMAFALYAINVFHPGRFMLGKEGDLPSRGQRRAWKGVVPPGRGGDEATFPLQEYGGSGQQYVPIAPIQYQPMAMGA